MDEDGLVETTATEVVGDDNVRHRVKHKLNVRRVGSTCHVTIYLLK